MSNPTKCIYCDTINPEWAKAHVMPRLMGTFKNQPTLLKSVCVGCDTEIGKCEALLAKCTIEAVLLKHIGIVGRHKDKSSSPFRRGHSGYPPIPVTAKLSGYENKLRLEPVGDSRNVDIIPQMILINAQGDREELVIDDPACVSLSEWRLLIKRCLDGHVKNLEAIGLSDEQFLILQHVFHEFGISFEPAVYGKISPSQRLVLVNITVTYDKRYFRAIAKIAFHYFLIHSKIFHGYEPEFKIIRRFIRYGEGDELGLLKEANTQPIAQDPSGDDRPPFYGHILRTDITPNSIAICIQLFIGHDYKPEWYRVILSQKKRMVFLQTEEFGHYYRYLEQDKRAEYDGVIEKISVAQIIRIPGLSES